MLFRSHNSVCGRVATRWDTAEGGCIKLRLEYPDGARGDVIAPDGYTVNGVSRVKAVSGEYIFAKI